jgi:hypothetical protein
MVYEDACSLQYPACSHIEGICCLSRNGTMTMQLIPRLVTKNESPESQYFQPRSSPVNSF